MDLTKIHNTQYREPVGDCYGSHILIGTRVAYNRSGEVKIGKVDKIVRRSGHDSFGRLHEFVTIWVKEQKTDAVSKISHPFNLVVI